MILGRNLLPTDGWFPKITWSGADGRECGLWTPHLLWTWEAHGSWRGRKHNSVHKAWGATAIRCAWKIVPFHKAPSTAGESVAIEINQDMQILCFRVTVWMMDVHYTQAHKHFIWEGQHNVFFMTGISSTMFSFWQAVINTRPALLFLHSPKSQLLFKTEKMHVYVWGLLALGF